jgi:hypothetical protein
MPDHPVKKKLRRDILPYLISSRRLERQPFFYTYSVFSFTADLLAALTALGLTSPFIHLLAPQSAQAGNRAVTTTALSDLRSSLPARLYYPALALVVTWIMVRVFFTRQNGAKRSVLAQSCRQTMKQAQIKLYKVLAESNPMPDLNKLLDEDITPTIDRNVQEGSWPWEPFAPQIDADVSILLKELCDKFEELWMVPPTPDLRQVP